MKHWNSFLWPYLTALLVLAGAGCASSSREFPIGLYDVPRADLGRVAAAGFNTVVGPGDRAFLDAARSNHLAVIAHLPGNRTEEVPTLSRHPALRAWYLYDEPDMHRVAPQEIKRRNRKLKEFTQSPTLVVLMSGSAAEKYRGCADLLAVDWYPVPWAPVATVAREMRLARLGSGGAPFYAILQAFDWAAAPQLVRAEVPLRPPNPAEMRCMTYLALMQGAQGLLYYAYEMASWKLAEHPEQWDALSQIVIEVRRNAPIFAHRVAWWPAQTEFHGPPAEMYNEIMEGRVQVTLHRVQKPAGEIRPGYYLVAANSSAASCDFSFRLPCGRAECLETTCAAGDFDFDGERVRKIYAPFEVCIFGPFQGSLSD